MAAIAGRYTVPRGAVNVRAAGRPVLPDRRAAPETCYLRPYERGGTLLSSGAWSAPLSPPTLAASRRRRRPRRSGWPSPTRGARWARPGACRRRSRASTATSSPIPGPLTEREVREALGLSHRAASLALAECEEWGLIERIADPVRVGRRGPSAVAYMKVGDHWVWFQRIAEQRKQRETDPVLPLIEAAMARADAVAAETPGDAEVLALRSWLEDFHGFVRLFDRAVGVVARAESSEIARGFAVLARVPGRVAGSPAAALRAAPRG